MMLRWSSKEGRSIRHRRAYSTEEIQSQKSNKVSLKSKQKSNEYGQKMIQNSHTTPLMQNVKMKNTLYDIKADKQKNQSFVKIIKKYRQNSQVQSKSKDMPLSGTNKNLETKIPKSNSNLAFLNRFIKQDNEVQPDAKLSCFRKSTSVNQSYQLLQSTFYGTSRNHGARNLDRETQSVVSLQAKSRPSYQKTHAHQVSTTTFQSMLIGEQGQTDQSNKPSSSLSVPTLKSSTRSHSKLSFMTQTQTGVQALQKQEMTDTSNFYQTQDLQRQSSEFLNPQRLANQFKRLQKVDQYPKKSPVKFTRRSEWISMKEKQQTPNQRLYYEQNKSCLRVNESQIVLNPRIICSAVPKVKVRNSVDENFFDKQDKKQKTWMNKVVEEAQIVFDKKQAELNAWMNPAPVPRKEPEEEKLNMELYLRDALQEIFVQKMKEMKAKQKGHVKDWQEEEQEDGKRKIDELGFKDLGNEIWSESDASENREEETHIAVDNTVVKQFTSLIKSQDLQQQRFVKGKKQEDPIDKEQPHFELERGGDPVKTREKRHQIMTESLLSLLQDQVNNALKIDYQKRSSIQQNVIKLCRQLTDPFSRFMGVGKEAVKLLDEKLQETQECSKQQPKDLRNLIKLGQKTDSIDDNLSEIMIKEEEKDFGSSGQASKQSSSQSSSPESVCDLDLYHKEIAEVNDQSKSKLMQLRASSIVQRMKYNVISSKASSEGFLKNLKHEPLAIYEQCLNRAVEVDLPLISKIINGKLLLQQYTLDRGHITGLMNALNCSQNIPLEELMLESSGISDEEVEILLKGLAQLNNFQILIYRQNVFMDLGLAAVKPLLIRPDAQNLLELKLVYCVTAPRIINSLLEFLVQNKVHLRALALVKMQLNRVGLELCTQFLKESSHIEDLDISYNNLIPQNFAGMLNVLAENKTLRSLNLACNMLIDKSDQNNEFKFIFQSAIQEQNRQRTMALSKGSSVVRTIGFSHEADQTPDAELDHPNKVIDAFRKLIRYNKRIQSIILDNTGLNTQVIVGLIPSLRHAKSLMCLHMASNPGINKKVQEYYRQRLSISDDLGLKLHFPPEVPMPVSQSEQNLLSKEQIDIRNFKLKHYPTWKTEEVQRNLNNRRIRTLYGQNFEKLHTDPRDLTISRIMGFNKQVPGVKRWKIQTVTEQDMCPICDGWNYTLYLWNEQIGLFDNSHGIGIQPNTKKELVKTVVAHNAQSIQSSPNLPVMFCSRSKWRPRPFMRLRDYLETLDNVKEPNYNDLAMRDAQRQFEFNKIDDLEYDHPEKVDKVKDYLHTRVQQLKDNFNTQRRLWAPQIIKKHLKIKSAALINFKWLNQPRKKIGEIYVLPIFLPPGKNDILVRTARDDALINKRAKKLTLHKYEKKKTVLLKDETAGYKFYYKRLIVGAREDRIPIFSQSLKISQHCQKFDRKLSNFRDWKEDTQIILQDCLVHDMKQWKAQRFCGDQFSYSGIKDVISLNFEQLKEIFQSACIQFSKRPDFLGQPFKMFLEQARVNENQLNSGIIDTYFEATNYEVIENDQNDARALCRHEFLEILIRLAKFKYIDSGRMENLAYAFNIFLQQHILPMHSQLPPLHQWRTDQLWNTEMDELIQVNIRGLRKLYQLFGASKYLKSRNRVEKCQPDKASIDQVMYALTKTQLAQQLDLGLSDLMIVKAFYLCKMTVVAESEIANFEYTFIHWPEFIEFLPRLAWQKYRQTYQHISWSLQHKTKVLLDSLFKLVGKKGAKNAPTMTINVSDSDDDY